jgi:phage FluMu protein Com
MNEIIEGVTCCPKCETLGRKVFLVAVLIPGFSRTKKCPDCKEVYEVIGIDD